MLCPMALPICPSSLRNLSPSRASLNSHPLISRSIQPSVRGQDRVALFATRSLNVSPMEHPPRESGAQQGITSDSFDSRFSQSAANPKPLKLWVIERATDPLQEHQRDDAEHRRQPDAVRIFRSAD